MLSHCVHFIPVYSCRCIVNDKRRITVNVNRTHTHYRYRTTAGIIIIIIIMTRRQQRPVAMTQPATSFTLRWPTTGDLKVKCLLPTRPTRNVPNISCSYIKRFCTTVPISNDHTSRVDIAHYLIDKIFGQTCSHDRKRKLPYSIESLRVTVVIK